MRMDYTGGCDKETKMQLWSTWILLAALSHHRLESIVVVVDISSMSVRTRVTRADGGIFIIVVLTALVSGASVVHPVRQVGLQPLVRKQNPRHGRDSLGNSTNLKLVDTEAADKVSTETISCRDAWKGKCWKGQCFHSKWHPNPAGWNGKGCRLSKTVGEGYFVHSAPFLSVVMICSLHSWPSQVNCTSQSVTWRKAQTVSASGVISVCDGRNCCIHFHTCTYSFSRMASVWG